MSYFIHLALWERIKGTHAHTHKYVFKSASIQIMKWRVRVWHSLGFDGFSLSLALPLCLGIRHHLKLMNWKGHHLKLMICLLNQIELIQCVCVCVRSTVIALFNLSATRTRTHTHPHRPPIGYGVHCIYRIHLRFFPFDMHVQFGWNTQSD